MAGVTFCCPQNNYFFVIKIINLKLVWFSNLMSYKKENKSYIIKSLSGLLGGGLLDNLLGSLLGGSLLGGLGSSLLGGGLLGGGLLGSLGSGLLGGSLLGSGYSN